MAKKDIFSKIIRNYNNELETILESKGFDSDVKNLLLSMLYRIENGYDDYKKVKVNVCDKNKFVREILEIIEERCNKIEIVKPTSEEGKELYDKGFNCIVDKDKGSIKTFQNEKSILDAIIQMQQEEIKIKRTYSIIEEPIKELLLMGNNMNGIELITDFNGWSWDLSLRAKKNIVYNNLYQILIMLMGSNIIDSWINKKEEIEQEELPSNLILSSKYNDSYGISKEEIVAEEKDYIKAIQEKFKGKYGEELEEEFFEKFIKLAILECVKSNKVYRNKISERVYELDEKLNGMKDNRIFTERLSIQKKEITKKIEQLDMLLSNTKELRREYDARNEKLENKEKIFSVSHLKLMLEKERKYRLKQLKEINKRMEPKEFVKMKNDLQKKVEFYEDIRISDFSIENTDRLYKDLEETFLKCFEIKINQAKENKQIEDLIYELRYYKLALSRIEEKQLENIENKLVRKACSQKILTKFSEYPNTNYLILKELFISRIIDLDTIVISLKYSKGILTLKLYDGNTDDETKQIQITEKTELNVRLNKKIKLWQ